MVPFYFPSISSYCSDALTSQDSKLGCRKERIHVVFLFCVWVPSLGYFLAHPVTCKSHDFMCVYSRIVYHCVYVSRFHDPFISWREFRLFPFPAVVNKEAVNTAEQLAVAEDGESFRRLPMSGTSGSYGRFIFSILWIFRAGFHGDCTSGLFGTVLQFCL